MIEDPNGEWLKTLGLGGGIVGILATAAVWARRFLSGSSSEIAQDRASEDIIQRLQLLLDTERVRSKEMEGRADQFARERNEAIQAMLDLRVEIERLRFTVEHQSKEIERLRRKMESGECKPD